MKSSNYLKRSLGRRPIYLLALSILLLVAGGNHPAQAQWTTSSGNTTSTDKVGIGTTSPGAALDVNGAMAAPTTNAAANGNLIVGALPTTNVVLTMGVDASSNAYSWLQSRNRTSSLFYDLALQPYGGRVGIGTLTPANSLHVNNASNFAAFRVSGNGGGFMNFQDTSSTTPANAKLYQWRSEGGVFRMALLNDAEGDYVQQNLLVAKSNGNVGFGTANPIGRLQVDLSNTDYTNTAGANSHLVLNNPNAGGQNVVSSVINGSVVAKWRTDYVGNISWVAGPNGAHNFYTGGDYPTGTPKLNIQNNGDVEVTTGKFTVSNGNVGLGASPSLTARLNVAGDVNVTGNIVASGSVTATYQDVAEWVPSSCLIPPATVVVLDTQKSNQVIPSSEAYDTRVAGVVSARPGVILGEAGENKVLVATTGRVKVKVDATRAAIHVGDLLVTSDKEGVAMKSEPLMIQGRAFHSPGTLIGKALEPLEKGTGEILVLLSLQ